MTVLTSPLARRFIPGDSGNERVFFFFTFSVMHCVTMIQI